MIKLDNRIMEDVGNVQPYITLESLKKLNNAPNELMFYSLYKDYLRIKQEYKSNIVMVDSGDYYYGVYGEDAVVLNRDLGIPIEYRSVSVDNKTTFCKLPKITAMFLVSQLVESGHVVVELGLINNELRAVKLYDRKTQL